MLEVHSGWTLRSLTRRFILHAVILVPIYTSLQLLAQANPDQSTQAKQVFNSLLSVVPAQKEIPWPPTLAVVDKPDINAFAAIQVVNGKQQSVVICYNGLLDKVVQGNADRIAYVLGHEIAHHVLGHTKEKRAQTEFLAATFTRSQELEADRMGMEISLRAGYSYEGGLSAIRTMIDLGLDYSSFEGLSRDHPSWTDRISLLDRSQETLWRSLSAFKNGTYFLITQNYPLAERAFKAVTKDFPNSGEAWANLGYAELMEYTDSLDESALRHFDIGQIVTGGFYRRPRSLEGQLRGINEELWWDAVGALREAIRINPNLALPRANLGIAYLIRPEGKDPGKAAQYLEEASALAAKDKSLDPVALLAEQANLAVAYAAMGEPQKALSTISAVETSLASPQLSDSRSILSVSSALTYNRAFLLAASPDVTVKTAALNDLKLYLKRADPTALWWKTAYRMYADLCKATNVAPDPESATTSNDSPSFRPVNSIALGATPVALGDDFEHLKAIAQPGDPISTLIPGTNLARIDYPDRGIGVIGADSVLAFVLSGHNAPTVLLKEMGLGASAVKLQIGMSTRDLDLVMRDADYDYRQLVNAELNYRFYKILGIAVLVQNGAVSEIVISQIPKRTQDLI